MKKYLSLLNFVLFTLIHVWTLQFQQACPEGGALVEGIYSGIVKFPLDDLNSGAINKNYYQQIGQGELPKNKFYSIAFSIVSFQGSGRQGYYSLMLKQYSLQNQNTRMSLMLDFQYPNSNLLSIWTQLSYSYLIVSQNLEKNGFSYIWTYMKDINIKNSIDSGIVDGDLFNHPNDKRLCGYDGKYWHTDGCQTKQAIAIYHVYVTGFKFNPMDNSGFRQLAFSVQLVNKKGQFSNDQKQQSLQVFYNKQIGGGPRIKIDYFLAQLQKIKVSMVMSIIQINYSTYPIGTFSITYSGIYFYSNQTVSGRKEIKKQKQINRYNFYLPGLKYFIYGISRFISDKALPRQTSIILQSDLVQQNVISFQQNFRLPKRQIIFSGDFYYKRIDTICQSNTKQNELQKNKISQMSFDNYPSNQSTYLIKAVNQGDILQSQHQVAIQYLYYPNEVTQQSSWVTYTFSDVKFGGSYIFYFSINQIGNSGFTDYTGYPIVIYVNQKQIYTTTIVGTSSNDKIQGIKKGMNIYNNSISVKIYAKIFRQTSTNTHFRINLLVKQLLKIFNPINQCCTQTCPQQSGLNITSIPIKCIICDKQKGFYYNQKYGICSCMKGHYFIQESIFPKCLLCEANLCDLCQPLNPTRCIECSLGSELDPYIRTCKCLPEFKQVQNKCYLNDKIQTICYKYGYCDPNLFTGMIYIPGAVLCSQKYFDNGQGSCSNCNSQCLTCSNITSCLTCDENTFRILQNGLCICQDGYFQLQYENKTRVCQKCAAQCLTCQMNSQSCTSCDSSQFMQKVVTQKGFFTCQCLPGYHSNGKGSCIQSNCNADKNCATCQQNNLCTSCTKISKRIIKLPEHTCTCMIGYYENNNGECQRCKDGCVNCNSSSNCHSCAITAKNNYDGSCSCSQGTFFKFNSDNNIGYCKKCPSSCETCIDQKICLTCQPTYIISIEKSCVCPSSYFIDNKFVCTHCSQGCSQCNSLTNCIKCKDFYHLQTGFCVFNCQMGFYKTQKQCFKCGQGCAHCQNSLSCDTCSNEYILYQSHCYKQCPEGTIKSLNQTQCLPCNSPCKTCMYHPSHCVSCLNGKGFLQQIGDEKKCLSECPLGTYPVNGVCELCDLNCLSCLGNKINCVECPMDQYLFMGKCYIQCPGILNQGTCINYCPNGYYRFDDKKCLSCSPNCLTCDQNPQKCSSCRQNLSLKNDKCIQMCNDNQFQHNRKCVQCSTLCKTCSGSQYNCTSCVDSFELINGECQNKCQTNQFFSKDLMACFNCTKGCQKCIDQKVCILCAQNFIFRSGKCQPTCNYPCNKCSQKDQCQSCVTGFYLMQTQKICLSFCLKGMRSQNGICKCAYGFYFNGSCQQSCPLRTFGNKITKNCEQCKQQNCAKCLSQQQCLICETNYILSDYKNSCISFSESQNRCPKGFTMQNSNCVKICKQQNFFLSYFIDNQPFCSYGQALNKIEIQKNISENLILNSTICSQTKVYENGQCKSKCGIGFYLMNETNQCKSCKNSCIVCKDKNKCQICENGYELINQTCFSIKCQGKMRFFNGKCLQNCPKGTYYDSQKCQKLCPNNHYLFERFCYMECPDISPLIQDFSCVQLCSKGYIKKGSQCVKQK